MDQLYSSLIAARLAKLLTLAGLVFLLIAVGMKIAGTLEPDRHGRLASAGIGGGLSDYLKSGIGLSRFEQVQDVPDAGRQARSRAYTLRATGGGIILSLAG